MSSKREREYERRRYEKWQERQAQAHAKQRRVRVIAGSVAGVIVLGLAVVGIVAAASGGSGGSGSVAATTTASPSPTSTAHAPDPSVAQDRTWTGDITLNSGTVGISLDGHLAPHAVANFTTLAAAGFFADTKCHRLTTAGIYVLQCGDPTATGTGDAGYKWGPIENAPANDVYPAGTIAMARSQNNASSMGSQFFIVYKDSKIPSDSAGGYTVFGKVTTGLSVIQAIADAGTADGGTDGAPLHDVIIQKVETQ